MQNSAERKRQDFSPDERQYLGVADSITDYRAVLRENLIALMAHHKVNADTLKAVYVGGSKNGHIVAARSVRNVLDPDGNTPGLDIVAAIATRFGMHPWQLLTPNLDPKDPPRLAPTDNERALRHELEEFRRRFSAPNPTAPRRPIRRPPL